MNPYCETGESCKEASKDEFNFILSGRYRERMEHPSRKNIMSKYVLTMSI